MSKLEELIAKYCPNGVEYEKFENVCKYIRGVTYKKTQEVNIEDGNARKVLRANNITLSTNTLNFDDVKLISKKVKVREDQILRKEDILICAGSGSKEHIGKIAYISEDTDFTFGGFMAVIRCQKELNSRFFFYILTSELFSKHLRNTLNSSTINNLNAEIMKNFSFPFPPLPVQREIVRILDNFTELTEELTKELTKELTARKKQYEYYRDLLLTFGDEVPVFLKKLMVKYCPNGVEYKEIDEIFELKNGYTPSKRNVEFWNNGTIPWFTLNDIRTNGRVLSDAIQKVTNEAVKGGKLIPKGSIIMSTTATIGEHAFIKVSGLTNQQITSFTLKSSYNNKLDMMFAFHYFFIYAEWCRKNANQSGGMAIISLKKLKKFKIPLPPLPVQREIVRILDRFDTLCNDLTSGLPAEIEARRKQYEYYRDKLLSFPKRSADKKVTA